MVNISLTKSRKVVVIAYLLLVFYVGVLNAPWKLDNPQGGTSISIRYPLFSNQAPLELDSSKLATEIGIATLIFGGIFLVLSSKHNK